MNRGKYVTGEFSVKGFAVLVAIVFPEAVPHADVSRRLFPDGAVSAGFFTVKNDGVDAFGESIGLGLRAQMNDYKLISRALGLTPHS